MPCVVNCVWDQWIIGDCSVTCGEGTRTNTRIPKVAAQFGGDDCDGTSSSNEKCKDQECPGKNMQNSSQLMTVYLWYYTWWRERTLLFWLFIYYTVHCLWGDWKIGECSVTCGEGTRNSTRAHKVAAQFGGDECDGSTYAIENCKEKECPGRIAQNNSQLIVICLQRRVLLCYWVFSSNHQFCSSLCMEWLDNGRLLCDMRRRNKDEHPYTKRNSSVRGWRVWRINFSYWKLQGTRVPR